MSAEVLVGKFFVAYDGDPPKVVAVGRVTAALEWASSDGPAILCTLVGDGIGEIIVPVREASERIGSTLQRRMVFHETADAVAEIVGTPPSSKPRRQPENEAVIPVPPTLKAASIGAGTITEPVAEVLQPAQGNPDYAEIRGIIHYLPAGKWTVKDVARLVVASNDFRLAADQFINADGTINAHVFGGWLRRMKNKKVDGKTIRLMNQDHAHGSKWMVENVDDANDALESLLCYTFGTADGEAFSVKTIAEGGGDHSEKARQTLARNGLRIDLEGGKLLLRVMNGHPSLQRIFNTTPHAAMWLTLLNSHSDASPGKAPLNFAGTKSRFVEVQLGPAPGASEPTRLDPVHHDDMPF